MLCEQRPAALSIHTRQALRCVSGSKKKPTVSPLGLCFPDPISFATESKRGVEGEKAPEPWQPAYSESREITLSVHLCSESLREGADSTGADSVNSLNCSAFSEPVCQLLPPLEVSPKPGNHAAHPGSLATLRSRGTRRTPESPTCSKRTENTYPGDDQRLVEVYAPRESEAPGRGAREDHVLGHGASWRGFLESKGTWGLGRSEGRPCSRRASPGGTAHCAPRAASSRGLRPGELYPRSRVTSPAYPSPRPLPPRRAPTLEESDAPDPREFLGAHWPVQPPRLLAGAGEASGYSFQHSFKVTPVLLIFYLGLGSVLHSKLKANHSFYALQLKSSTSIINTIS